MALVQRFSKHAGTTALFHSPRRCNRTTSVFTRENGFRRPWALSFAMFDDALIGYETHTCRREEIPGSCRALSDMFGQGGS